MNNRICFISGKGGAGKTSVALSIALYLSQMNKKVLLIDFDSSTHGASYFLKSKNIGLEEFITANSNSISNCISETNTEDKFHFIASKTVFKKDHWNSDTVRSNVDIIVEQLQKLYLKYDYVLFDCQAGVNELTASALSESDRAVIVTEADSISTKAIQNLRLQFHEVLPDFTKGLINKLFLRESTTSSTIISLLKGLDFLPPIPFDMDIRESFARSIIPLSFSKKNSYLDAINRIVEEIFPELNNNISEFNIKLSSKTQKNIEIEKNLLEDKINALSKIRENTNRSLEQLKESSNRMKIISVAFLLIVASFTPMLVTRFFAHFDWTILTAIFGSVISYTSLVIFHFFRTRLKNEMKHMDKINQINAQIDEAKQQIEKYRILDINQ